MKRFQWHPRDGFQEMPAKLWRCMPETKRWKIRKLRKARRGFTVTEDPPNTYHVTPDPLKP